MILLTLLKCDPVFVPSFESKPSIGPALENRMTDKVYSRKKVVVPQLIQVQESEPTSKNEVIVFCLPLQTESKLQFEKPIDQNLPIAIRKGMRECAKCPLYPLSHVSFEKFSIS